MKIKLNYHFYILNILKFGFGLGGRLFCHLKPEFKNLEMVEYSISTAQKTNRGLATTAAILSYIGKPFKTLING
jgi:hypothetical protein